MATRFDLGAGARPVAPLAPPPAGLLAREIAGFAVTRIRAAMGPAVRTAIEGDGRTVVVIPGFLASDATTSRLRRSLENAGFVAHGWGLGRNRGVSGDTLDRLAERLDRLAPDRSLTLIGWSLGGLIAREFAKNFPQRTAKVITLGSPFSGSPRANHAWRVYEHVAGHSVDTPPIATILAEKPPVPTVAIWSPRDGIVAAEAACGGPGESDLRIRVDCTHMALVADPVAIRTVASAILD